MRSTTTCLSTSLALSGRDHARESRAWCSVAGAFTEFYEALLEQERRVAATVVHGHAAQPVLTAVPQLPEWALLVLLVRALATPQRWVPIRRWTLLPLLPLRTASVQGRLAQEAQMRRALI
jgi:hypothetical protein